jgi:hypothetical protein
MQVLLRIVCECRLRKLLNCNSLRGVEKTGLVIGELHTYYEAAISD